MHKFLIGLAVSSATGCVILGLLLIGSAVNG